MSDCLSQIPAVTADFSHLKMLGHVYIVEDAKDLAQIVKDVARYGGAYRPEVSQVDCLRIVLHSSLSNLSFDRTCTSSYSDVQTGRRSRRQ